MINQDDVTHRAPAPVSAARNIEEVLQLERNALDRRSRMEYVSDLVVTYAGQLGFLIFHVIWFASWIAWNRFASWRFDPFPYQALTTAVSLEAIFLSIFILRSQNRSSKRSDERSHLDLQINLLAEYEATKMLGMLRALCAYHHLIEADDPEVAELSERTDPATLAKEIETKFDDASPLPEAEGRGNPA